MSKISVLVAVYNAEKYLHECLDSLINQTLCDIQIICIDDASTDNSLNILYEYAQKDDRIIVLQQAVNSGQARARNLGLSVASGEFITMVDSDDWISENALEEAYQLIQEYPNTDVVLFDLYYYEESTDRKHPFINQVDKKCLSGKEACQLSLSGKIHGVNIVRASIHKRYPYDESSLLYSDDNTTRLHYLHSREVRFSTGIYYYRQHLASFTKMDGIRRIDWLEANLSMRKALLYENIDIDILRLFENYRWINTIGIYGYYIKHKSMFTEQQKQQIERRIRATVMSIDVSLLKKSLKYKFGYIPFQSCYFLFLIQEKVYYALRKLLGR